MAFITVSFVALVHQTRFLACCKGPTNEYEYKMRPNCTFHIHLSQMETNIGTKKINLPPSIKRGRTSFVSILVHPSQKELMLTKLISNEMS